MVIKLRILAGPAGGEPAPTTERLVEIGADVGVVRLGRRAGLEVELPFPALSPVHARIARMEDVRAAGATAAERSPEDAVADAWTVEDLGSAGGTWLDGARLTAGEPRAIAAGQTLRLAHVSIAFEGVAPSSRAAESTGSIARRLVSDLFRLTGGGQAPRLVALAGTDELRLTVPDRTYFVGRAETCDLVLAVDDVSREHAALVRGWEGVILRDLGSKNGVRVGGEAVAGERRVGDGDVIEIGSIRFRLDDPEDRYLRQIDETGAGPASRGPAPAGPAVATLTGGAGAVAEDAADLAPDAAATRRGARVATAVAGIVLMAGAALAVGVARGGLRLRAPASVSGAGGRPGGVPPARAGACLRRPRGRTVSGAGGPSCGPCGRPCACAFPSRGRRCAWAPGSGRARATACSSCRPAGSRRCRRTSSSAPVA
jgi:pSer/pThr/pTyr-binding forkhead associated (FHA) protein